MDFRFIWQNGQKECRSISLQPTNADESDENRRRKVYSFTLENEKVVGDEEYIYPVALWFRLGITKLGGNRRVTFLY